MAALVCLAGCATSKKSTRAVSYSQTAASNYKKGADELKDENFAEARKYFNFVKNRFPFSRYSTLAELGLADSLFAEEKYTAAIDAYKLFVKFHPTHPKVGDGYAEFRIAEGYVRQIPGDWFLIPPGHEKDQSATRQALAELVRFRRRHRRSSYSKKAAELQRKVLRRLVNHELYVARFYLARDKPKATILRLEGILRRYPNAGADPEVMLLLGKTYLKLNKRKKAQTTFATLVKKYPQDANAAKAKLYLNYLAGR
jgi:outer membrane protein assembly factor BamD